MSTPMVIDQTINDNNVSPSQDVPSEVSQRQRIAASRPIELSHPNTGSVKISHSQDSQEPCAPKDPQVKVVKRKRQQPTPQFLATFGIKVRDFAYESKLPPVKIVYRQPKQIQPSSQRESQGPRPLERTVTEPVIEPDSHSEPHPLTREAGFNDIDAPNVAAHYHLPTLMDIGDPHPPPFRPLSRALQPAGRPIRLTTPAPQPIPMVPTSPTEHQVLLSAPIPTSSPVPFSRPQGSIHPALSRNNSRHLYESHGRNVAFVRSPYKLRKRPIPPVVPLPPPAKRRRVSVAKGTPAQQESETPLPATRRRKPTSRGKGRGK